MTDRRGLRLAVLTLALLPFAAAILLVKPGDRPMTAVYLLAIWLGRRVVPLVNMLLMRGRPDAGERRERTVHNYVLLVLIALVLSGVAAVWMTDSVVFFLLMACGCTLLATAEALRPAPVTSPAPA